MKTFYQILYSIFYEIYLFWLPDTKPAIHFGLKILKYLENKIEKYSK